MLVFNSGRKIEGRDQIIEATVTPAGVMFRDLVTGLVGLFQGVMTSASIMLAYDTGEFTRLETTNA